MNHLTNHLSVTTCARNFLFIALLLAFPGCSFTSNKTDALFTIKKVDFIGSEWNDEGREKASVISQDGGYSNKVPNGSLWWFGDTFLGRQLPDGKFDSKGAVSCTLAFLDEKAIFEKEPASLTYFTDKGEMAAQAIEYLENEAPGKISLWPLAAICLNGKYYVYYSYIEKTGSGTWDFKQTGSGLAVSDKPLSQYKRVLNNGDFRFPVSPAELILSNGWLYCYSIGENGKGVYLSRVKSEEIENPDAYYFYSGNNRFSINKKDETLFLPDVYGQLSIAYNKYLDKYVMATSSDFNTPRKINIRTSLTPLGPWSESVASIEVPEFTQNGEVNLVYCSFFHPELFKENGRIMVITYSIYLNSRWFNINNEMIEVEIEKE